jgi:hypothetical protein
MFIMKNNLFNHTLLRKYSKDFNLTPSNTLHASKKPNVHNKANFL